MSHLPSKKEGQKGFIGLGSLLVLVVLLVGTAVTTYLAQQPQDTRSRASEIGGGGGDPGPYATVPPATVPVTPSPEPTAIPTDTPTPIPTAMPTEPPTPTSPPATDYASCISQATTRFEREECRAEYPLPIDPPEVTTPPTPTSLPQGSDCSVNGCDPGYICRRTGGPDEPRECVAIAPETPAPTPIPTEPPEVTIPPTPTNNVPQGSDCSVTGCDAGYTCRRTGGPDEPRECVANAPETPAPTPIPTELPQSTPFPTEVPTVAPTSAPIPTTTSYPAYTPQPTAVPTQYFAQVPIPTPQPTSEPNEWGLTYPVVSPTPMNLPPGHSFYYLGADGQYHDADLAALAALGVGMAPFAVGAAPAAIAAAPGVLTTGGQALFYTGSTAFIAGGALRGGSAGIGAVKNSFYENGYLSDYQNQNLTDYGNNLDSLGKQLMDVGTGVALLGQVGYETGNGLNAYRDYSKQKQLSAYVDQQEALSASRGVTTKITTSLDDPMAGRVTTNGNLYSGNSYFDPPSRTVYLSSESYTPESRLVYRLHENGHALDFNNGASDRIANYVYSGNSTNTAAQARVEANMIEIGNMSRNTLPVLDRYGLSGSTEGLAEQEYLQSSTQNYYRALQELSKPVIDGPLIYPRPQPAGSILLPEPATPQIPFGNQVLTPQQWQNLNAPVPPSGPLLIPQ